MAKKGSFSKVYDKNGDCADVEAVRFDGTRTFQMQGDVTASQTWDGGPSAPLTLNTSIGAKKVTQYNIADKAVGTGQMADGSVGLTQMAASAMTDTVSANNSKLVTSQGVNAAIAAATLNRGKDYGPMSVDEINAISETIPTGSTVYVESLGASDAKVINDGYSDGTMASFSVEVGEDLKYYRSPDNSLHGWYSTEANVKIKQPANYAGGIAVDSAQDASSGSAGIEFIQSFKQNTNGDIRDIVKAQVDIVDSVSSTRTDAAATPNSVKSAYDLANGKYSKPSGGIPKSDLASGVQTSLDKADSALRGVKLAGASSALTPDANKVVTVPNAVPTGSGETNGLMTAADKAKLDGIASGANKVEDSNTNGNIKIDGTETNVYTHPSAGPSSTTSVGDTTNQTPAFGGTFKAISQTVNTDGHTTATSEHTVTLPTDGKDLTSTVATVDNYTNPGSTATALKTLFGKIWNFIGRLRTSWQTTPDDTHFPSEKLVKDSLDLKADKVSGATNGNFAALDSNGNLTDSGKKASDFATASQGTKADSAIQGVKVNNTTLTPGANKVVTVPLATTSADGAMSAADKTKLNGIKAGAEANVQADWNETDSSSDAFIQNKPFFRKISFSTGVKFLVCSVWKYNTSGDGSGGIEVFYRRGNGAVYGELMYKARYELYLKRIGDASANTFTVKFYYITNPNNSSYVDIYADCGPYCQFVAAPMANMPKDSIDFTGFGTVVSSLPEGATEITPVWVANSANSSGTAPVKVDEYGALTPVPMDSTPTPSSTNLMTSGDINTALDAISTAAGAEAEVTAAALNDLDARMQSVEDAVNSDNIGDKIADSLDAQVLKVGGQDVVANIEYVAAQSGGGGDLMKTVAGTRTSVLRFMNDTEAVAIWNDAKQVANAS